MSLPLHNFFYFSSGVELERSRVTTQYIFLFSSFNFLYIFFSSILFVVVADAYMYRYRYMNGVQHRIRMVGQTTMRYHGTLIFRVATWDKSIAIYSCKDILYICKGAARCSKRIFYPREGVMKIVENIEYVLCLLYELVFLMETSTTFLCLLVQRVLSNSTTCTM